MNSVEIKITSQGLDAHQASALSTFLTSLGVAEAGTKSEAKEVQAANARIAEIEVVDAEEEKPAAPKRTRTKKETAPKAEETTEEEVEEAPVKMAVVEEEEETEEEVEAKAAVTLMQIRSLVAAKQANHKDQLRKKLQDLGANNVSTLDPKHYVEFHELLTSLN